MSCKVTDGIDNSCAALTKVSGVAKKFWVGYLGDLDSPFSIAQTADISQIDFGAYGALYAFEGSKFAHDFTWELSVASGGNKSYNQSFNWKLTPDSTTDDANLQSLLIGDDIFIVVEDLNQEFFLLGAANGLTGTAATGGSGGKESGGDTADSGTLSGNEKTKPLRFRLGGGYAATKAYLEAFEA